MPRVKRGGPSASQMAGLPPPPPGKAPTSAFSGQKKKKQLQEKRARKRAEGALGHSDSGGEEAGTSSKADAPNRAAAATALTDSLGKSGTHNKWSTIFAKENKAAVDRRRIASGEPLDLSSRGQPVYAHPLSEATQLEHPRGVVLRNSVRFNTTTALDAYLLDAHAVEERAFQAWLHAIYERYSREQLNYFEHNLEVWMQLWHTLATADVICIIADVRNPLYSIPQSLYDQVVNELKKPLIVMLNKTDLVSQAHTDAWLEYLGRRYPSTRFVPFSASGAGPLLGLGATAGMALSTRRRAIRECRRIFDKPHVEQRISAAQSLLEAAGAPPDAVVTILSHIQSTLRVDRPVTERQLRAAAHGVGGMLPSASSGLGAPPPHGGSARGGLLRGVQMAAGGVASSSSSDSDDEDDSEEEEQEGKDGDGEGAEEQEGEDGDAPLRTRADDCAEQADTGPDEEDADEDEEGGEESAAAEGGSEVAAVALAGISSNDPYSSSSAPDVAAAAPAPESSLRGHAAPCAASSGAPPPTEASGATDAISAHGTAAASPAGASPAAAPSTGASSPAAGAAAPAASLQSESSATTRSSVLTIGMVGHPNVGKSSVINTLCAEKRVSVSRTAGHTKRAQTIPLAPGVNLLDCPGLLFPHVLEPRGAAQTTSSPTTRGPGDSPAPPPTPSASTAPSSVAVSHQLPAIVYPRGNREHRTIVPAPPRALVVAPTNHHRMRVEEEDRAMQELCGVIPLAQVREPYTAVRYLAEHLPVEKMYGLSLPKDEPEWSPLLLCEALATKRGVFIAKVGRPDAHAAGREILYDVQDGVVPLAWLPPPGTVHPAVVAPPIAAPGAVAGPGAGGALGVHARA